LTLIFKIPALFAPFLYYQIWEIPLVASFLLFGPLVALFISVINTAVLIAYFPGNLPTGPLYNLAAVLSMLLQTEPTPGIKVLYITPLRALNRDMLRRILAWGEKLGLSVDVRHGDTPASMRRKQALKPPDILLKAIERIHAGEAWLDRSMTASVLSKPIFTPISSRV
jgi:hypothetical protein